MVSDETDSMCLDDGEMASFVYFKILSGVRKQNDYFSLSKFMTQTHLLSVSCQLVFPLFRLRNKGPRKN